MPTDFRIRFDDHLFGQAADRAQRKRHDRRSRRRKPQPFGIGQLERFSIANHLCVDEPDSIPNREPVWIAHGVSE